MYKNNKELTIYKGTIQSPVVASVFYTDTESLLTGIQFKGELQSTLHDIILNTTLHPRTHVSNVAVHFAVQGG